MHSLAAGAAASQGLLKLHSGSGMLEVLATHVSPDSPLHPGTPITYANDLAVAPDGAIYFTSCSNVVPARNAKGFWDTFRAWQLDLAQVSGLAARWIRFGSGQPGGSGVGECPAAGDRSQRRK
jgi:sugar lactone lactonase YvrE